MASAEGIEQLLMKRAGTPSPKPAVRSSTAKLENLILASGTQANVTPISGSLKDGLNALSKNDVQRALAIRAGMKAGTLDRKLLAWSLAVSGKEGLDARTISNIARDLHNWPAQDAMIRNIEKAMAREGLSSADVINSFSGRTPSTADGAMMLAKAYRAQARRNEARKIISRLWRNETLDRKKEQAVLASFSDLLTRDDHRYRMHRLFYRDRIRAAQRVAPKAEQVSLSKARAAAIRASSNAKSAILGVAPSSKTDLGYTFARIEYARRIENFPLATKLLKSAPRNTSKLVDPDEWWVERRIASRNELERGNPKTAYELASNHSAQSASAIIDAEFHAGWYALRFLNKPEVARKHFARLLEQATIPASKARGHYWLGRATSGETKKQHYRNAAKFTGTYYGQLAAYHLGVKKLSVTKPKPSDADRKRFKNLELVRAFKRFEQIDQDGWAKPIYRHLAKTLSNSGEVALLSAAAEKQGDYQLALQVGKISERRGFDVDTLSWPLGAIPNAKNFSNRDRALAYAVSRQESEFNKAAVSPAKARGLMQLLPGTAKAVARQRGMSYSFKRLTSDAAYNAKLGSAYLDEQLEKFNGSYVLTFIAYNAGPRRVEEWIKRFGDPRGKTLVEVIDWVEKIPFTETRK